ncbi:cytochrome c oxidase subunit II [Halorientalis brevis]|uniref:Cytochrome c oxidase subunit II n=1 Tax=Halorientalis brevis TaxID=1126241 RepID=A0ABD6CEB6_9EURY|nr:cytochrome c oxidase subunit II [Halorientalis brevis]
MTLAGTRPVVPLQLEQILPRGTRVDVFTQIYWVFLALGTLVGVVVIGYMLYNAWKYRDDGPRDESTVDRPQLGELPEGGGKGRKLFISFSLSAIIVVSLIVWTYAMLLYVEQGTSAPTVEDGGSQNISAAEAAHGDEPFVVEVTGIRFSWQYTYPNGHTNSTLTVPRDRNVTLRVTSDDVMHNFGIPAFRVKTDAIPGSYTTTWFQAERTGTFQAQCYELCGSGHSYMTSDVRVLPANQFETWYANTGTDDGETATANTERTTNETAGDGPAANGTTSANATTTASPEVTP